MCQTCKDIDLNKLITDLQDEIMDHCQKAGFEPDPNRTFGDEIALLHEEISEAWMDYRKGGLDDRTKPVSIHSAECPVIMDGKKDCTCLPKPEGVAAEFADVFIRILHYSRVHDFDLIAEVRRKIEYNKTRPYHHGKKNL